VLQQIDEVYIFFICVAVFLTVIELGYRLGRKLRRASDESAKAHIGALQTALLGLLALLLGFTFAMSVTRFETRKNLVPEEANAIGNAYWRSQLLPPAAREPIAALLREYADTALEFHDADNDSARLALAGAASRRIERQIRSTAAGVLESPPSMASVLFIQAINDMAQVNEKRRVALENHVPEPVFYLLFIVTTGAMAFIAYGTGLQKRRRLISTGLFATLISLVLTFILDIDQPASGLIQVNQDSMLRIKATLEQER
jgi:hypothetical protein